MHQNSGALSYLVLFSAVFPMTAAQFWNSTSGTDFSIMVPMETDIPKSLSWHEASTHCIQRNGSLARAKHFDSILHSTVWLAAKQIWIGLGWIEGRLQWMGHVPMEELNMTAIQHYAKKRVDTDKSCYSMDENEVITEMFCNQKLPYVCVMPYAGNMTEEQFSFDEIPNLGKKIVPKLISEGEHRIHSSFLVIQPPTNVSFNLFCQTPDIESTNCSSYRYRWLRNGAYKSEFDGNVSVSDSYLGFGSGQASITAKTMWWILNWSGKVACEILCTSTGQAYRSKEKILVLPNSVSLRVEFQFKTLNFSAMQNYFEIFMQPQLRNQTGVPPKLLPVFQLDFPPFLSYPEKSTDTYSFYVHWANMNPNGTQKLSVFLRNISALDSFNHWMSLDNGDNRDYEKYFQNIEVIMLNYCLDGETDPTLVFANQPTLATVSNSRFHTEDIDDCEYASRQCTADWFNPAWFKNWSVPIACVNCLASFHDYKGRCLKIIKSLPFTKSIAQCMAEYQRDQIDGLWEMSDWIRFALDWVDENTKLGITESLNLNQLWLPVQRRTNLGPLRPVWPWQNFTGIEGLTVKSWGEELYGIVVRSGLLVDWSKLNASLSCLKLDTQTRTLESALCTENIPMICTRPRLKSIYSSNIGISNRKFSVIAQCPLGWNTSTLIVERNYCYKIFSGETFTFDEAEAECRKLGGHLAIAAEPSTLTAILIIFDEKLKDPFEPTFAVIDFWIGLKKNPNGFKWIDQSNWTFLHLAEWSDAEMYPGKPDNEDTIYGVSLTVIPNFSNKLPKPLSVKWKTWVKEARLNGFICQQEIFPQRQLALQIQLNSTYRPFVSIQRIPLHLRGINHRRETRNSSLLEEIQPAHEAKDAEPPSLSLLTCFMENSTFSEDYGTSNESTVNYNVIKYADGGIDNLMEWQATEISCETWNEWSTENLKASWVMSSTADGFFSYIVILKHRTEKYLSENYDATFLASNTQRETYKQWGLHDMFIIEFPELHPRYVGQLVPATDPVAFEAESSSSQSLLIKYRIVMKFDYSRSELPTRKRRGSFGVEIPGPMPGSIEEACLEEIRFYFSSEFNKSRNASRPFSERLEFLNVRSTEFCPSEYTTIDGKFVGSPRLSWWSVVSPGRYPVLEPFSPTSRVESPNSSVILSWPMTTAGSRVTPTPHCVTQDGSMLSRRCLGDQFTGVYWESLEKDQSGCVKTSPLFDTLYSSSTWMLGELGTTRTLETIRRSISNWNPNLAELELLSNSLSLLSKHTPDKELNDEDVDNFNAIIHQINSLETEKLIQAQRSSAFSSDLSRATERFFSRVNMTTNEDGHRNFSQRFNLELPFVAVTSWERSEAHRNGSIIGFTVVANENSIVQSTALFHAATFEKIQESNVTVLLPFQRNVNDREQVMFIAYPDSRLIDASAASGRFSSAVFMSDSSNTNHWAQSDHLFTGNGGMVQVYLSPAPPQLIKPLTILFRPRIPTTAENRHLLRCVFWDEQINFGNGGWSIDGCWLEGSRNGLEVCHCNHLSTFTLLVSSSEKQLQSTVHGAILNFITLIGSLASILGLLLILATFAIFPSWRKPLGHKLLVQLSAALIVLLITFIAGVDRVSNSKVCRLVAVFLHYFLLAAFCWMTIEAYNQYQRLVKVLGTYTPRFLLKVTVLAWTMPLLPVIAVLIYDVDSYTGSDGYCWIQPSVFYLAVLGPVVILFIINLGLFVLVIRSIANSGRGLRTNQSESKQAKEKFMASFMNFVLLGMSWIFGFFAIGPTNSVIFSYLFCLSTTLQGFFLFVLYVGRDPSARQLWFKRLGFKKSDSNIQSNKSKATSSADTNSKQSDSYSTASTAATESFASGSVARKLQKKGVIKGVQPRRQETTSV